MIKMELWNKKDQKREFGTRRKGGGKQMKRLKWNFGTKRLKGDSGKNEMKLWKRRVDEGESRKNE